MTKDPLVITTESYRSEWQQLAPNLISLKRTHLYKDAFETVDTFGNYDLYAYAHLNKGDLIIKTHGKTHEVSGLVSIFIPAFSVIHWKIFSKNIQWNAYISNQIFSKDHSSVCLFSTALTNPKSVSEITTWIKSHNPYFIFNDSNPVDDPATEAKKYIDDNFQDIVEISELANRFKLSTSQISKVFKKRYGISPVEYRSKLRVFQSMYDLLTQSKEVVDIAFSSGFNDLSRFNKQFKKITNSTPSKFKFNNSQKD